MNKAISNTSPLLYLYRIGAILWLPELFEEVWIPDAVKIELQAGRSKGYDVPDPSDYAWLKIVNPKSMPSEWLALDLGAGEIAAMALALSVPTMRSQELSQDSSFLETGWPALLPGCTRTLRQAQDRRPDSHRQIGFFRGFGCYPFRGRVSPRQPPIENRVNSIKEKRYDTEHYDRDFSPISSDSRISSGFGRGTHR